MELADSETHAYAKIANVKALEWEREKGRELTSKYLWMQTIGGFVVFAVADGLIPFEHFDSEHFENSVKYSRCPRIHFGLTKCARGYEKIDPLEYFNEN